MISINRVPEQSCPECSRSISACSTFDSDDDPPRGGDLTLCIYCFTTLVYDSNLELHLIDVRTLNPKNISELKMLKAWFKECKKHDPL